MVPKHQTVDCCLRTTQGAFPGPSPGHPGLGGREWCLGICGRAPPLGDSNAHVGWEQLPGSGPSFTPDCTDSECLSQMAWWGRLWGVGVPERPSKPAGLQWPPVKGTVCGMPFCFCVCFGKEGTLMSWAITLWLRAAPAHGWVPPRQQKECGGGRCLPL